MIGQRVDVSGNICRVIVERQRHVLHCKVRRNLYGLQSESLNLLGLLVGVNQSCVCGRVFPVRLPVEHRISMIFLDPVGKDVHRLTAQCGPVVPIELRPVSGVKMLCSMLPHSPDEVTPPNCSWLML